MYNGICFRSRLEARWAVFFDVMGIKYEYEPKQFTLDYGVKYTPDFALHNVRWRWKKSPIYVEIKGFNNWLDIPMDERVRIESFSKYEPLIILGNIPQQDETTESKWDSVLGTFAFLDGDYYRGFFSNYFGEIWFAGGDHIQYSPGSFEKALSYARQASFEQNTTASDQNKDIAAVLNW